MVERGERLAQALATGGVGAIAGTALGMLLAARPVEAAPTDEKLNYLIDCLTVLMPALLEVSAGQSSLILSIQQLLAAQGDGVAVTVNTPWIAGDEERIFDQEIRTAGVFNADKMVDFRKGKRMLIKVESNLDQALILQPVGNMDESYGLATNINGPIGCGINGNASILLAWDDWHPFVGITITTGIAPTTGKLNIRVIIQE